MASRSFLDALRECLPVRAWLVLRRLRRLLVLVCVLQTVSAFHAVSTRIISEHTLLGEPLLLVCL
jgi:hypothetical protein